MVIIGPMIDFVQIIVGANKNDFSEKLARSKYSNFVNKNCQK
jgi:hypothetical protein